MAKRKTPKPKLFIGKTGAATKLLLDGKLIPNCSKVTVVAQARGLTTATMSWSRLRWP